MLRIGSVDNSRLTHTHVETVIVSLTFKFRCREVIEATVWIAHTHHSIREAINEKRKSAYYNWNSSFYNFIRHCGGCIGLVRAAARLSSHRIGYCSSFSVTLALFRLYSRLCTIFKRYIGPGRQRASQTHTHWPLAFEFPNFRVLLLLLFDVKFSIIIREHYSR